MLGLNVDRNHIRSVRGWEGVGRVPVNSSSQALGPEKQDRKIASTTTMLLVR